MVYRRIFKGLRFLRELTSCFHRSFSNFCQKVMLFSQTLGSLHNSSLAERQFVKIPVYHAEWTKYIHYSEKGFESVDHCAFWCKILPSSYFNYPCHLFHVDGTSSEGLCYFGTREYFMPTTYSTQKSLLGIRGVCLP